MANRKESLRIENASKKFSNISDRAERMFRVFLGQIFPGADISYEAYPFTIINKDGTRETTIPDYRVVKPNGKIIFIEITKDRRNGTDPKERDRNIMRQAAPNYPYIVLYCRNLKSIQRKYKGFDFFKKEKKKKEDVESPQEIKPRCVKVNFPVSPKPSNLNSYKTK